MIYSEINLFLEVSLLMLVFNYGSSSLRCLTCTQCDKFISDYQKISNEPCNGRCYIRKDLTNLISRGCDIRFWYSQQEQIPDNGCKVRNDGEIWCWCNSNDYCNFNSIESYIYKTSTIIASLKTTTISPADDSIIIYEGCLDNPCENGGTCYTNQYNSNFFICICSPFYTGKTCSIAITNNAKSLENFLHSFLQYNFKLYQNRLEIIDESEEEQQQENNEINDQDIDDLVEIHNDDYMDHNLIQLEEIQ